MNDWYYFDIKPKPALRMTQNTLWTKEAKAYAEWKKDLQKLANVYGFELSHQYEVEFYMPMAKSWSNKKKLSNNLMAHNQMPDIDNLLKAFQDALKNKDHEISQIAARAYWSKVPLIAVRNISIWKPPQFASEYPEIFM